MKKLLTFLMLLALAIPAWAGEQTILITSNDASGVYYTSKGGVKMEMSGGMNNEGFMVQRHYDQINFRSYNFKIKKIVFRCLDNSVEGDNDSFYWGPTTMYIAPNTSVNNVVAGTLTTPYNNSTYMAEWVSSPTYADGLPIGQQLTIKCQGHPVRFAYIEITIDKEDGDMYELVTNSSQIVTGDKTYMLVHRLNSSSETGDALSSNQQDESTSGHFLSTSVNLYNNGFLARASGDVMFLRFSESNNSSYPYYIIAGGAYFRTESTQATLGSGDNTYTAYRLSRTNGMTLPQNTDYALASLGINSSTTGGTNGFDWYALMAYKGISGHRIRHYNGASQFRNIQNNNSYVAQQRVFLYKPAQKYEVFTATDGHGTITLRDGIVVDGTHNYSQMMDNVSFIVAPVSGYKIKNVTITNLTDNTEITPTITTTTLGQNYAFSMPGSDVSIYAEFEAVQYHNITMVVKPNALYGNIFLTDGYVVQNDQVKSYEGENVVFNVTPNLIDVEDESKGYHELYSVTVTYTVGGQEVSYTYTDGDYNFTMPDADVTITATFIYENGAPLYLLGTANGGTWQPNGIRFNYDPNEQQYYLDVYFKGVGEYGDTENYDPYGYFSFAWKTSTSWDYNNQNLRGVPMQNNQMVDTSTGGFQLFYNPRNNANESNAFKIPAGIYRFYVKSYNEGNDWLYVVKDSTHLTLDPMGGETAATALQVSEGAEVTLSGDLYNKIMEINPNEAAANFKYLAVKNNTAENPVPSTTTASTTLNKQANEDETLIELRGYNYLGWIVAGDTAFYKVIETPLSWIEKDGVPGNTYTVSDELIIVHILNREASGDYPEQRLIWAKDQGNRSNNPTSIKDGQIDYMRNVLEVQHGDWDQSNWVMLKFPDGTDLTDTYERDMCITAGTLKGRYVDNVNYCIEVDSMKTDGRKPYTPNVYSTPNYLDANLNLTDESTGAVSPVNNKSYFFMNPKVQEVADVVAAVWNGTYFVIPEKADGNNSADLNGAFTVGWDYNNLYDASSTLVTGNVYSFRGVLNMKPANATGSSKLAVQGKDVTPDATKQVMPFELVDKTPTAISDVDAGKTVSSVKYYNITGMESDKPFSGVNIVVTRYTDGSFSTTKVLR